MELKFEELSVKHNAVIENYYPLALRIAGDFKAPQLGEDLKETVACNALIRAVDHYDPLRSTAKFSSFLFLCITNELKSEVKRFNKKPIQVAEIHNELSGEMTSIFEVIETAADIQHDWDSFKKFTDAVHERLSERHKMLFEMLVYPEASLQKYTKQMGWSKEPRKMTYQVMGKIIGRSTARVATEVQNVREIVKAVYQEIYI